MSPQARRCAVLGHPIAHSLSPVLHRAAYDETGLGWSYDAVDVTEHALSAFLEELDGSWRGLSLTMPLKRAVMPLLDSVDDEAARAGAANTVVLEGGRRQGHNTDVPGAVTALTERWSGPLGSAVVLGGGATAASMLLALADLGCRRARLVVRDPGRVTETLAAVARHPRPPSIEVVTLPGAQGGAPAAPDVAVSTIPATAQDAPVLAIAAAASVVFDVVYDPWPTPLARAALEAGQVLVSGMDLLVHQAALQFELMTGVSPAPVPGMRDAGEAALAARGT